MLQVFGNKNLHSFYVFAHLEGSTAAMPLQAWGNEICFVCGCLIATLWDKDSQGRDTPFYQLGVVSPATLIVIPPSPCVCGGGRLQGLHFHFTLDCEVNLFEQITIAIGEVLFSP